MHFRTTYKSLPWLRCKSGAKEHSSHLSHNNKQKIALTLSRRIRSHVEFDFRALRNWARAGMVEWNGIFRLFRFSGILGQPREVHPKFRNEIPENVCSIRSQTRNFRNFWTNGKRPLSLPRAGEDRISPIHFPISDFLLLFFFHGVDKNWQEQRENGH